MGRVIGINQKRSNDYSPEMKAKMDLIFLLLPWPYRQLKFSYGET